jgi:hypothetical protein
VRDLTPRSDRCGRSACWPDGAPKQGPTCRVDGHEIDLAEAQGQTHCHDRIASQSVRVVSLAEEQQVTQQRPLRRRRQRFMSGPGMADDHRRLQLGESVVSGVGNRERRAERQPARQSKTHQRQEKQAQHGTLDQGWRPRHDLNTYHVPVEVQVLTTTFLLEVQREVKWLQRLVRVPLLAGPMTMAMAG